MQWVILNKIIVPSIVFLLFAEICFFFPLVDMSLSKRDMEPLPIPLLERVPFRYLLSFADLFCEVTLLDQLMLQITIF